MLGFLACCCGGCPLWSDDFERPDSTSLGSNWTETTGAWEIVSGRARLVTPASGRGRLTVTGGPYGNVYRSVSATVRGGSGVELGVRLGDVAGIVIPGTGEARIVRQLDGDFGYVRRSGLSIPADEPVRVRLCADLSLPSSPRYSLFVAGARVAAVTLADPLPSPVPDGPWGRLLAGGEEWDDFAVDGLSDGVNDCPVCTNTPWPGPDVDQVLVEVESANVPQFGYDWSGSYTLDRVTPTLAGLGTTAANVVRQFELSGLSLAGGVDRIAVTVEESLSLSPGLRGTVIGCRFLDGDTAFGTMKQDFGGNFAGGIDLAERIQFETTGPTPLPLAAYISEV